MKDDATKYFLDTVKKQLSEKNSVSNKSQDVSSFPLAVGQCLYVMNFKTQQITFQKRVKEVLGYNADEFTFDLALNCYHPEDQDMLNRLLKATVSFARENNVSQHVGYYVSSRVKHKNGTFKKILRQSNIYETDNEGKLISNLSLLTDISFIDTGKQVQWEFKAPGLDAEKFRKHVMRQYADFFSKRELEILHKLCDGKTSSSVAEELNISKHTVDGHRRKMLEKSHCTNTIELINFGKMNGLI